MYLNYHGKCKDIDSVNILYYKYFEIAFICVNGPIRAQLLQQYQ